jgi:hypothetical protein
VASPRQIQITDRPARNQAVPSLESRLVQLRRRRRLTFLKRVAAMGPVLVGTALLGLAAFGGIASFR